MAVPIVSVNLVHVLVAAIAAVILGFLWYGPLFGKPWMHMMGISHKQMEEARKKGMMASGMGKSYFILLISSLVFAYILAHFVKYVSAATVSDAIQLAFWIWLGFIATVQLGSVLWEKRPWKLYLINTAYYLVSLIIQAIILTRWM